MKRRTAVLLALAILASSLSTERAIGQDRGLKLFISVDMEGIGGIGTTAVMLGALLGLNVTPGPLLIERSPDVFWGLVA